MIHMYAEKITNLTNRLTKEQKKEILKSFINVLTNDQAKSIYENISNKYNIKEKNTNIKLRYDKCPICNSKDVDNGEKTKKLINKIFYCYSCHYEEGFNELEQ